MEQEEPTGVVVPETGGRRSTSALGRSVVEGALRATDPVGARAAAHETNWRTGYVRHFRRAVEAGLLSPDAAVTVAAEGLAALHERMRWRHHGVDHPLVTAVTDTQLAGARPLATARMAGSGEVERRFTLPYRGERLEGAPLRRRLDDWVSRGVIEPSCAQAVGAVVDNPGWLDLTDLRFVVLGAGAEMGPLPSLLRWGATVIAVDLPRPGVWQRVLDVADRSGGQLLLPVRPDRGWAGNGPGPDGHVDGRAPGTPDRAGVDVVTDLPVLARWLADIEGPLVLGNYVYADGVANLRVATAVDALTVWLTGSRPGTALAVLATPTDVFAVPHDAVRHAQQAYDQRSRTARWLGRPLRTLSGGRLLQRNYVGDPDPGLCDALVPQQGPNYALAKRLQRWRATVAARSGTTTSMNVAPPTRTRSVVKNRVLAAAYAGAHRFGVEVFEPATSNTLMAALLVHDLRAGRPPAAHPWQDEAHGAAHGGLWRAPYAPRSALGLAALVGVGGART